MKQYSILIILIAVFNVLPQGRRNQTHDPTYPLSNKDQVSVYNYIHNGRDSVIQSIIEQTNPDTLIHSVKILSGEDSVIINGSKHLLVSRNPLHPHNDLAADFIFKTLSNYGMITYNQVYSSSGRNVYAIKTGTEYPDQKFIICAHYDCSPALPPAPGADDNASGTATVLEAARILSCIPHPFTIIFALWDEEEIGHFGSRYFAKQAFENGEKILGVVNLEMFGWDKNDDGIFEIHTDTISNSIELGALIRDFSITYDLGLNPRLYNPGTPESDHASFWKYGYTAVVFSQAYFGDDFNPFYQTANDKIEYFNRDYFYKLSKLSVGVISYLALYSNPTLLESPVHFAFSKFSLRENYPNPFNPSTTIELTLPRPEYTTLKIYNILGAEVATLVSEKLKVGLHTYTFDGSKLASGVYYYEVNAGAFRDVKKMILIK